MADTQEFQYLVRFAHEDETQEDEAKRHGAGQIEITTDHLITTEADKMEIARFIGKKNGYTKVGITHILQMVEDEGEEEEKAVDADKD